MNLAGSCQSVALLGPIGDNMSNNVFRLMAVDPGETCGVVVLSIETPVAEGHSEVPILLDSFTLDGEKIPSFTVSFLHCLRVITPHSVAIENYRVFASKAGLHIGDSLMTSRLIGAIQALCAVVVPSIEVSLIEPSEKGRWPLARIKNKVSDDLLGDLDTEHEFAALQVGLTFLEREELWIP